MVTRTDLFQESREVRKGADPDSIPENALWSYCEHAKLLGVYRGKSVYQALTKHLKKMLRIPD